MSRGGGLAVSALGCARARCGHFCLRDYALGNVPIPRFIASYLLDVWICTHDFRMYYSNSN